MKGFIAAEEKLVLSTYSWWLIIL